MDKQELKQVLGEVFDEKLEPFARTTQGEFTKIHNKLEVHDKEFRLIKTDLLEVKTDVSEMKENAGELFKKLDDFIGMYKKHEEELTSLFAQMERLKQRVEKLEQQNL